MLRCVPGHRRGCRLAGDVRHRDGAVADHPPVFSPLVLPGVADKPGFSATYTVNSSTKISKNRQPSDISQVATNDQVSVMAINAGGTLTAQRISDTGPAQ